MRLDDDQIDFLMRHKISIDRVFDATGMKPSEYQPLMKEDGYEVAVGVTPCRYYGHTLRGRKGHCVQCNPASIAFQRRFDSAAYVYVAESLAGGLVKVGYAADPSDRMGTLNGCRYAGFSDWGLVESFYCTNAGRVEADIQAALVRHQDSVGYVKQGAWVECSEAFSCSAKTALDIARATLAGLDGDSVAGEGYLDLMREISLSLISKIVTAQGAKNVIEALLRAVPKREQVIVRMYYGLSVKRLSKQQIAKHLNVSTRDVTHDIDQFLAVASEVLLSE